jgi:hypothetical protein
MAGAGISRHLRRPAHHRSGPGAGHEALLCRAGLWRQRHHLLDDTRGSCAAICCGGRRCGRRFVFVHAAV